MRWAQRSVRAASTRPSRYGRSDWSPGITFPQRGADSGGPVFPLCPMDCRTSVSSASSPPMQPFPIVGRHNILRGDNLKLGDAP